MVNVFEPHRSLKCIYCSIKEKKLGRAISNDHDTKQIM